MASRPFQNFLLLYFFTGLLLVSLAAFTVYNLYRVAEVFLETSRKRASLKVGLTKRARYGEAWGHRDADTGHLRQPGSLAAEQLAIGTLALGLAGPEEVHVLTLHNETLP